MNTVTQNATSPVQVVDVSQVLSVYSGKAGKCCCGCSGKHYYASARVQEASKDRGYPVTPEEVSDRMVTKVVGIINSHPREDLEIEETYVCATVGSRWYIAYVK